MGGNEWEVRRWLPVACWGGRDPARGELCRAHLDEVFGVDDVPPDLVLHVRPARSARIVLVGPLHVALVLPRLTLKVENPVPRHMLRQVRVLNVRSPVTKNEQAPSAKRERVALSVRTRFRIRRSI